MGTSSVDRHYCLAIKGIVSMLRATEPGNRQSVSLRMFLRIETSEHHKKLDFLAASFGIECLSGYAHLLAAHAAAVIPLERALNHAGVEEVLPDWPRRARSAALLCDLAALNVSFDEVLVAAPRGEAEIFGVLYVLEGSRLGARVILNGVGEKMRNIGATHYFHHGAAEKHWSFFLTALENSAAAQSDPRSVLASALATFAVFQRAFEKPAQH